MIRLERNLKHSVHRRAKWVVMTIGFDRHLLTPAEAVDLANKLVDSAEEDAA